MQKYVAEIFVPNDADWQTIEDAKAKAEWKRIITLEERMARTNLEGKCGGCVYFNQKKENYYSKACGVCVVKDSIRERCQKACKTFYKEKGEIKK